MDAYVDQVWIKIRGSTIEGNLGYSAKVEPASRSKNGSVICIYTYDYGDEKDVWRVAGFLKTLGVTKSSYKTNEDTIDLKYRRTESANISKYKFGYTLAGQSGEAWMQEALRLQELGFSKEQIYTAMGASSERKDTGVS